MVLDVQSSHCRRTWRLLQDVQEHGSGIWSPRLPTYSPLASFSLSTKWEACHHSVFFLGLFWSSPDILDMIKLFEARDAPETSCLGLCIVSLIKPRWWQIITLTTIIYWVLCPKRWAIFHTELKLHEGRNLICLVHCCSPSAYNSAWHTVGAYAYFKNGLIPQFTPSSHLPSEVGTIISPRYRWGHWGLAKWNDTREAMKLHTWTLRSDFLGLNLNFSIK